MTYLSDDLLYCAAIISKHLAPKLEAAEKMEKALTTLLTNHGDYIFQLPGESGVSDLASARAALAAWKASQ
jgi:hypothetical protein